MNPLFSNKYAQMKAAGQHADVCLLNTQEGWVTFGSDAWIVCKTLTPGESLSDPVTVYARSMPHTVKALTDAGHSVALLDYWSPSLAVKPQPTLIVRLEGKVSPEDWI